MPWGTHHCGCQVRSRQQAPTSSACTVEERMDIYRGIQDAAVSTFSFSSLHPHILQPPVNRPPPPPPPLNGTHVPHTPHSSTR